MKRYAQFRCIPLFACGRIRNQTPQEETFIACKFVAMNVFCYYLYHYLYGKTAKTATFATDFQLN